MSLTQQKVAALLNTDVQNIGRWEREEAEKVPGPAQVVIRLMYDEQVNGKKAIIEPLRHLAELQEPFGENDEVKFTPGPGGWSVAA